ncbi:aminobenzoyl-glutamate transport protein [Bacteroidales bacterium]|nr:aminobenzoyl-glutamate transport protein [Bacteroidales bacterium]
MKKGFFERFLNTVERAGNALPHPAILFASFALLVLFVSWLVSYLDPIVLHPSTGESIKAVNLISQEGLHLILTKTVTNFTNFAPLGTVLVALLGVGIAERSGLIGTALRQVVIMAPTRILSFVIVFAGVISNTASEVGYVLLVPLAATMFVAAGRHPLAGLAAAFAGVSGGYSANLLLGTIDPLLAGLSEEAAHIIDVDYIVSPACNYYFMFVSTFLIAGLGTLVTERIIIPRLGLYVAAETEEIPTIERLTALEKRGLWYALGVTIAMSILILWGILPENGILRDASTGSILKSPLMQGIVTIIFVFFGLTGIAYGLGAKTFTKSDEVIAGMSKSMETLGSYIVLVFFAAQFVAYFSWSNIGLIFALKGAAFLQSINLSTVPLVICFVLLAAVINLVMGSASAKWAIMAPVFIPMLMMLGYSPEFTQLAYRIGDSVSNIISPMMSYFALIVAFIAKYDKKAGIGTVVSLMLPYSFVFLIGWLVLLFLWIWMGLPIGPGAEIYYKGLV